MAIEKDELSDDPQTLEDYGLSRCTSWYQKSHLLGFYKGLLWYRKVDAGELDRWLREGSLVVNIVREYNRRPKSNNRFGYYPWFLKNKHLLDKRKPLGENHQEQAFQGWIKEAKSHLPLEEQTRDIENMLVGGRVSGGYGNCSPSRAQTTFLGSSLVRQMTTVSLCPWTDGKLGFRRFISRCFLGVIQWNYMPRVSEGRRLSML
ncbi:hypothetical protein ASPCAL11277 [Aspergillus calidoustus]|uniref:Uncharacterized protein n=1 Tax=Aspergillus calidoustus TaxID=454130 RepID=A0A0U5CE54_ASPCI|nr:hypothetical protein ASPCAL11277 [Aspergillus calidoustus]